MKQPESLKYWPAFVEKMLREGVSSAAIETFRYYYEKAVKGETGLLFDKELLPVRADEVQDAGQLHHYAVAGKKVLKNAVAIVLNGGLGTSMGLTGPKSLLTVKAGKTFLEIILQQAQQCGISLVLMNSFNTHQETLSAVSKIDPPNPPLIFVQNKFPKILQNGLAPAIWPKNPTLEWNPAGHGDIYTALYSSGLLDVLIDKGIVYAFVANSDNLGACMDEALLGYFSEEGLSFMMEVSDRTPLDMKGGHLARYKNGRLILREFAQCPKEELRAFKDINCYNFFNTNNLWINLTALKDYIQKNKTVRLQMILNSKTLDPRDEDSPKVYQIETAMGSAISLFEKAAAVKVPRSRFFPIKKCNELLGIRSDCYLFAEGNRLIINQQRTLGNLKIRLDPRFYGKIDQLEARFKEGAPSLLDCESLTVIGDVCFEKNVKIVGSVIIENKNRTQAVIKAGTVIDSDLTL